MAARSIATVKARSRGAHRADAIPWLLLDRAFGGRARAVFSARLQRPTRQHRRRRRPARAIARGGAGQLVRVPYSADYYFFTRNSNTFSSS